MQLCGDYKKATNSLSRNRKNLKYNNWLIDWERNSIQRHRGPNVTDWEDVSSCELFHSSHCSRPRIPTPHNAIKHESSVTTPVPFGGYEIKTSGKHQSTASGNKCNMKK